jgi:hypothetical protein
MTFVERILQTPAVFLPRLFEPFIFHKRYQFPQTLPISTNATNFGLGGRVYTLQRHITSRFKVSFSSGEAIAGRKGYERRH